MPRYNGMLPGAVSARVAGNQTLLLGYSGMLYGLADRAQGTNSKGFIFNLNYHEPSIPVH